MSHEAQGKPLKRKVALPVKKRSQSRELERTLEIRDAAFYSAEASRKLGCLTVSVEFS